MSTSASLSLQKAVFAALAGDATLVARLGGARIHDDAPQAGPYPCMTFGQSSARDFGSVTEAAEEHVLTLHVWSRGGGKKETLEIAAAARAVLHDAGLALDDYHLVNLRHELTEARRDPDGETIHGIVRFRAVTEPIV